MPLDLDGDGIDDLDGLPYSSSACHNRRSGGSRHYDPYDVGTEVHSGREHGDDRDELEEHEDLDGDGRVTRTHADQFAQHKDGASTHKTSTKGDDKRSSALGEAITEEEEQELKHLPAVDSEAGDEASNAGRKSAQASEAAAEDVVADSVDEREGHKSLASVKKSDKKASKRPAPAHQRAHAKKQSKDDAEKQTEAKIDSNSKEQIEQLSNHLGAIEGKVSEITRKYEELKKADEQKDQTIK